MRAKEFIDYVCMKTSVVVGTGIHAYSLAINDNHFDSIYQDFVEGRPLRGALKSIVPYILPYAVSFYARKKAQREARGRINQLEKRILELSNR